MSHMSQPIAGSAITFGNKHHELLAAPPGREGECEMGSCRGTARFHSTPCLSFRRPLFLWSYRTTVPTCTHDQVRERRGRFTSCKTARSNASASAAAAAPDPGLEAFKALIGERRFTCTQCGKCCTGAGEVWVSDAEAANIARYLNLPLARFLALHCHGYSKVEGFKLLRSNMESETQDCTFLRPDNTCAIHPVRPLQCSTYPWWPELMDDKEWQLEKETICEGFDHPEAPLTDLDAAAQQLKIATIQEYQKRLAYKPSRKQVKKAAAAARQQAGSSSGSSSSTSKDGSSTSSSTSSSSTSSSSPSTSTSSAGAGRGEQAHKEANSSSIEVV